MRHGWHKSQGFTLIELMITVALLAILLMMVSSLTGAWSDRNHVQSAKSSLQTAIKQARISAIRNAQNKKANVAATSVCIDSSTRTINTYSITGSNTACAAANTLLRTANYSSGVTFKQGSTAISCFVFTAGGILLDGGVCVSSLDPITVKKNAEDEEIDAI